MTLERKVLETDYLIVGAGAVGMSFADQMLTESAARLTIIDRRPAPGGHWNDAYPFVRLHQPSAFYGVGSRLLGAGRIDEAGWNAGYFELASGAEVVSYFDRVMRERFLPSGRVRYLPMCEYVGDGRFVSRLSGEVQQVAYRKLVDATWFDTKIPATHTPAYEVADGVRLTTPGLLPRIAPEHGDYVIVGGGKTAADVGVWLLEMGADPDDIRWIRPRDAWFIDRDTTQPGDGFYNRTAGAQARMLEAVAEAHDPTDLFLRLERAGQLLRIDRDVRPTMYRGATMSRGEAETLSRIRNVIRLGHVRRIGRNRIVLDQGEARTRTDSLYIDCTARALGSRPTAPVFKGDCITLQMVRAGLICFSAALMAHFEATMPDDDAAKNALCFPIPAARTEEDWLRTTLADLRTAALWSSDRPLRDWVVRHRLSGLGVSEADPSLRDPSIQPRIRDARPRAIANLMRLVAAMDGPEAVAA